MCLFAKKTVRNTQSTNFQNKTSHPQEIGGNDQSSCQPICFCFVLLSSVFGNSELTYVFVFFKEKKEKNNKRNLFEILSFHNSYTFFHLLRQNKDKEFIKDEWNEPKELF